MSRDVVRVTHHGKHWKLFDYASTMEGMPCCRGMFSAFKKIYIEQEFASKLKFMHTNFIRKWRNISYYIFAVFHC